MQNKAEELRGEMITVFPQLAPFSIEYAWCGNTGFTKDYFPVIGGGDGISYAMGYCGHGVAMATYFGFKLAKLVLNNSRDSVYFENVSKPIPFYHGKPWFLPLVHNWLRFLDRIDW